MINFMGKIELHALVVKPLYRRRIMMTTNMKVPRNLIYINESAHFAPFIVVQLVLCLIEGSISLVNTFLAFLMLICFVHLRVDFSLAILVYMS